MVADFRKKWENNSLSENIHKLFLKEWETSMPKSRCVCFPDVYLDDNFTQASKSPDKNCYLMLDYPYFYENQVQSDAGISLMEFRRRLRLLIKSVYYQQEYGF